MKALEIPSIFRAVDKFSGPVNKMTRSAEASMSRFERSMRSVSQSAFQISRSSALVAAGIIAPMIVLGNEAVKFEDRLADISKTTGISDQKLTDFGTSILDLSKKTRTSIDELLTISEIGGQLGVAEKDLLSFVDSADKFNIALGSDFNGVDEAVSQIGKIKSLFEQTRGLDISASINKTGSAINELGAVGSGTSANITDFTLRLGALPDALKPSIESTLALGTYFEELGLNSEIASSGLTKILLTAGKDMAGFGKQMGMTKIQANKLLSEDPTEFVKKFAESFNGLAPDKLSNKLENLGLNSQEAIKVLGALGSSTQRLTELQTVSSRAFEKGESLKNEAEKKNKTTAAQMEIAKNNFQALAITLGTTLIPIILKLTEAVTPIIERFSAWASENQSTVSTIMKVAAGIAVLMVSVSLISAVVGTFAKVIGLARYGVMAYNVVLGVMSGLSATASIAVGRSAVALKAYAVTQKIVTAATKAWAVASAFALTPIGLITLGVAGLSAGVYALSKAWSSESTQQKLNNEVRERALENSIEQRVEATLLFKALKRAEEGSTAYNETLKKLEQLQPGIIEKYNLQAKSLQNINAAEKELIGNIMKRAEEEARAELMKEKIKQGIELQSLAEKSKSEKGGFLTLDFEQTFKDASKEKFKEADMLAEQQAQIDSGVINPSGTQTIAKELTKEEVTVTFNNLPEGTTISRSKSSASGFNIPKLGTTRQ